MNLLQHFSQFCLCILLCFSSLAVLAQSDTRVQYFPKNESHYAGLFTYSTITGKTAVYFAQDGKWLKEKSINSPKLSISGDDFRMQFVSGNSTTLPGLFVYSTTSGAFEFFYLHKGTWESNNLLPASKSNLSSKKVRMVFEPYSNVTLDYISIYATDKQEFEIVYLDNNNWQTSDSLPQKITY